LPHDRVVEQTSQDARKHASRVVRTLRIVIGVAGLSFVAQGVFNELALHRTESEVHDLVLRSIRSVEQLARVTRDLDDQRALIDDHIFEKDPAKMQEIEARISLLVSDLRDAMEAYTDVVDTHEEADEWNKVRPLIERFQARAAAMLELSRQNLDEEARQTAVDARDEYDGLQASLTRLVAANGASAAESTNRVARLQGAANLIQWIVRTLWLLGLFGLGAWAVSQVKAFERLQLRNRDLDAFAGRVAHDLKNAMAPISLSAHVLTRQGIDAQRVAEVGHRLESSSRRTTALVESLLAFARGAENVGTDEAANVTAELQSVIEEVSPLAQKVGAQLELDAPAELTVRCDPGLLHVLLSNLVGNAVKFLDAWPERRVRIQVRADRGNCLIQVEDTGPGIPRSALGRIFEPFFRVENRPVPGLGIGLATVQRIVDARGGRVSVESTEGKGSIFRVWLPLVPPAASAHALPAPG
jgi:signal transduction histidine kinase